MSVTLKHVTVVPSLITKRAVWFSSSYARVFKSPFPRTSTASSVLSGMDARKVAMAWGSSMGAVETSIVNASLMAELAPERGVRLCATRLFGVPAIRSRSRVRDSGQARSVHQAKEYAILQLLWPRGVFCTPVFIGVRKMRKCIVALVLAVPLALLPGVGTAKGCLKGAAVGGVVGHVAGRHAVVGAAAGCVIEHHREKVRDKAAAQQNKAAQKKATDGGAASTAPSQ